MPRGSFLKPQDSSLVKAQATCCAPSLSVSSPISLRPGHRPEPNLLWKDLTQSRKDAKIGTAQPKNKFSRVAWSADEGRFLLNIRLLWKVAAEFA